LILADVGDVVEDQQVIFVDDEADEGALAVEAPRPPKLDHLNARLVVAADCRCRLMLIVALYPGSHTGQLALAHHTLMRLRGTLYAIFEFAVVLVFLGEALIDLVGHRGRSECDQV
jgi:hypothetical protein